ncbi:MAG: metal ABC transporter permease [FCB group bacterium]|jgi:zinc transport system permease protein
MSEILSLPFIQKAIIAGILVGFLGSYYGVFIVQRKMSFMGDGLAHAAFGGVALGIMLQTEPLWIAVPFTILVAILITWLKDRTKLGIDTSIGILFAVSVALGIIFLTLKRNYTADAFSYLFGSILAVKTTDLWFTVIMTIITIFTFYKFWSRWAYATFDAELARTDRLPVLRDDYILSILIAVTVVISVKLVGIILIAAFLVIPAATARLVATTFLRMTVISIILGILSSLIGLWASFAFDLPSGATIIIIQTIIFLAGVFFQRFAFHSS